MSITSTLCNFMLNSILAQDIPIYCGGTTSSSINSCAPMFDIPDVLGIPTIRAISANSSGPWAKGHAVPRVPQVHMMLSKLIIPKLLGFVDLQHYIPIHLVLDTDPSGNKHLSDGTQKRWLLWFLTAFSPRTPSELV